MADQKQTNLSRHAWCVHCQLKWDSLDWQDGARVDVSEAAAKHADETGHLVHMQEWHGYDIWPTPRPTTSPAVRQRDARPKV